MLRYRADLKTLLWMVLMATLLVVLWRSASISWLLYPVYLYLSITAAIMAHNHNHVRMWKNRTLNHLTDIWITIFYGFPVFGWIPTHNKNHHRFNNKQPDHTHTWRYWEANNALTMAVYPAVSAYFQQSAIAKYWMGLYGTNRRRFWACASQVGALVAWVLVAFLLDWRKALILVVIPQQVSLTSVLIFNYLQHVHADEEDGWNHSRNITGPVLNFLFFNNGFHTVHHHHPGLHWSLTPAAHREIEHRIDPTLNEPSLVWYLLRTYLIAPFVPSLRRRSMRLERQRSAAA